MIYRFSLSFWAKPSYYLCNYLLVGIFESPPLIGSPEKERHLQVAFFLWLTCDASPKSEGVRVAMCGKNVLTYFYKRAEIGSFSDRFLRGITTPP